MEPSGFGGSRKSYVNYKGRLLVRTRFKFDVEGKPDFIFCADLHIRETTPSCRTNTFLDEMVYKLTWLKELADNWLDIPVLCAGDVFDTWKTRDWWLFNIAYKLLPDNFICIAGQHELPRHSLELPERSPLSILHAMERITLLGPWDSYFDSESETWIVGRSYGAPRAEIDTDLRKILLTHEMIWDKKPYPGAPTEGNTKQVFKRYPEFDVIVSGDNHTPFTKKTGNQLLVNCGSMLRTTITQRDYKPAVWLYYTEDNRVEPLYIPVKDSFEDYEYVEDDQDGRIAAVVKRINEGMELDVSFEENMKRYLETETPPRRVREILVETIGG